MSKNGLLVCSPSSPTKNIGDYIQSVAQEQFWNHIDCYCEREALDEIESEDKINLIMNGWFMWKPERFPPSDCINPLFISFHIVPLFEKKFFTKETVAYLKKYEPIGARDIATKLLLESHGVKSYFSSCLTLTLGMKYKNEHNSGEILFVDPIYDVSGTREKLFDIKLYLESALYLLKYGCKVKSILSRFQPESRTIWSFISKRLNKLISACHFYASYKTAFDEGLIKNASVITHNVKANDYPTNDDMMAYAKELVNRYARARLVVTSRIHCALPCLALETPVIFIQSETLESIQKRSPGRMNGLIDLFNVFKYDRKVCLPNGMNKVTMDSKITNSDDYKKYRDSLINQVTAFTEKHGR